MMVTRRSCQPPLLQPRCAAKRREPRKHQFGRSSNREIGFGDRRCAMTDFANPVVWAFPQVEAGFLLGRCRSVPTSRRLMVLRWPAIFGFRPGASSLGRLGESLLGDLRERCAYRRPRG